MAKLATVGAVAEGGFLYYLFRDNSKQNKEVKRHIKYLPIMSKKSIYDYHVVTIDNVN